MKRRIGFWTSGFVKWICLLLACALSLTLLSLPNIKSAQAAGQVYYVDNVNGSDANSGLTEALAWKNLPRVNDATFAPGDQILFKRGGIWKGLYQILIPPSSGTAAAPIVFGSYGTGDLPIIDGEGIRRCVKVENKSYLTFQELDCRNGNVHGLDLDTVDHITIQDCVITDAAWAGVYSSAGQYVLVENCTISGGYAGIEFVDNTQYSRIHNNVVHNCSHAGIYPGHSSAYNDIDNNDCYANGAGIYLSGSDHNLVHNNHSYLNVGEEGLYGYGIGVLCGSNNEIYDNEINNNTSDGIEFWSGDPLDNPDYYTCDANKVYRNKIYSNARTGILLDGSVTLQAIDNEIFYNLIYDNGDPGIRISIDSGSGNKLYNNTIVGNAGVSASAYFGITFDLVGSGIGGWDVKNNIVTDNTRGEFYGRSGCTVTNDHNQYHRISGTVVNYNETTYDTAHVTDFEATALAVDPLFVDETNHDYRLQPSSSAINAGINVGLTTDLNGNPIIGQPEIGCFESNQVAPAPTPTPPTSFTLSGQVTQADNSGLDGVTLSRSDGGSSVVTANGGSYSLTVPSGWSGQLTPSYSNGSFDPVSRSYSNVSANQSGQDFRWTAPAPTPTPPTSFTLAGRVTQADNSGLDGVTLSRSDGGGSVVTANGGSYSLTVPAGWSGQLTPSYSNGSFDPVSRSYSNVSANQSGQDFRWTAPAPTPTPPTSFTLAGRVTQADNSGLDGVTLSRSDGGGSVVTANGGLYSVTVPSGWSGQLTPSYSNGSFDPVSRSYSNVSANQSGQDFRWTAPAPTPTPPTSFTLAGRVTQADNSGLDGVTLSRSDGGGSVVTANGGSYSLTVPSGWSGQLTPSYSNGSLNNVTVPSGWSGQITPSNSSNFDPVSRTYMNVTSEQSSQDYRWSPSDVPSIRVLTPNGGESWRIGSKQRITWTSTNLAGNISIEFSTDGGRTWAALFASTPNDGQEQWTVAGVAGNQNQVRIISTVTPSIADTSDSNFAIVKSTKKMRIAVNQGWNLIATPVQPDSNADQIFASLPSGWRFYAWDSASLCYLTGTEVVSSIGNGYWLYSPIASNLDIEGDSYAGVLFEKPLPMGWNLIGSPSVDSYQLSNLRIELNANTYTYQEAVDLHLIAPGLFAYKGSQYEDAGTTGLFEPGFGYWIKTLVADCILVF